MQTHHREQMGSFDMINLILMLGIPGSGKSTKAAELAESIEDSIIVSRDDIRHAEFGCRTSIQKPKSKPSLYANRDIEKLSMMVLQPSSSTILTVVSVVVQNPSRSSDSLRQSREDRLRWYLIEDSFDVDLCHKRNTSRERSVPYTVIESMFINFIDFVRSDDDCAQNGYNQVSHEQRQTD